MSAFTNLGDRVIDNDGNIVASRITEDWSDTVMGKRWFNITVVKRNNKPYYVTRNTYLEERKIFWDVAAIKRNLDIYTELDIWDLETFSHVIDLFALLERGWAFTNEYVLDHLYDVADFTSDNNALSVEEFFHQVGMGVINNNSGEMAGKLDHELEYIGFEELLVNGAGDLTVDMSDSTFWNGGGVAFGADTDNGFIPSEVIINILESWQPDPDDDVTVSDASGHVVIDLTSDDDVIDLTMED